MKKIMICMMLLQGSGIIAQTNEKAMNAYLKSSAFLWEQAVKQTRTMYQADQSNEILFELAVNEYGLLNATMADQNEELFDKYIDQVEEHLELLEEANHRKAEVQSLISAICGLKIAYSPWKGMLLGPKAGYLIDEAVSQQPESPIVQKLLGNYLLFTPETWGGDVEKAVAAYDAAIQRFEQSDSTDHWLYIDAWVWKGQALMKLGRNQEAVIAFERVQALAPGFTWVTDVLLPQAKKS